MDILKRKTASLVLLEEYLSTLLQWEAFYFGIEAWKKENFLFALPKKFEYSALLFKQNELVAYCINSKKEQTFYIHKFIISPNFVGQGYGKLIMEQLIFNVKEPVIALKVEKSNLRAISFYQKFNFEILKEDGKYYQMQRING
jgi:ribosomal protein S18 acetylase RimI-like enzyme